MCQFDRRSLECAVDLAPAWDELPNVRLGTSEAGERWHDGVMTLEVVVRGVAEKRYVPERATVTIAAAVEGFDKHLVYTDAVGIQEQLLGQLSELVDRGAVTTHASDQVHVISQRPWGPDGARLPLTHYATVLPKVEFVDFERLSGFIDYWAGKAGV